MLKRMGHWGGPGFLSAVLALASCTLTEAWVGGCAPLFTSPHVGCESRVAGSAAALRTAGLRMAPHTRPAAVTAKMAETSTISADAWKQAFKSVKAEEGEVSYQVGADLIAGSIPTDFTGTLYRNGPAGFELGQFELQHPMDGDGMLSSWTFPGDGTCAYRNRFVRSEEFAKEQDAIKVGYTGKPIKKGFFGSDGMSGIKNPSNTGVVFWAGRLLALFEGGMPMECDFASLYAKGETRMGKSIPSESTFTARPKYDPAQERLVGFRYKPAGGGPVNFVEYDSEFQPVSKSEVKVPGYGIFHDIGVTRSKYILHQGPLSFDSLGFTVGLKKNAVDAISYDQSKGSQIHIVPRDGGEPVTVEGDGAFVLQVVNAFDEKNGDVVMDVIQMKGLPFGSVRGEQNWKKGFDFEKDIPNAELVRWTISASSKTARQEVIDSRFQLFPTVNAFVKTVRHRFTYTAAAAVDSVSSPPQGIRKWDMESREFKEFMYDQGQYCGEPMYVPRTEGKSEDDGYLLTQVYDASKDQTRLDVFDALKVEQGPICSIQLKESIPLGIYGCWAEGIVPTDDDIKKGKLAAAFQEKLWNEVGGGLSLIGI